MEELELTIPQKLSFFRQLLHCEESIASWVYAPDGHLIETDSPVLVLNTFFERTGCLSYVVEHARHSAAPLVLGAPFGLAWGAAVEPQEGTAYCIHVIGPVINSDISLKVIREISHETGFNMGWRSKFEEIMNSLPVMNHILLQTYLLQLHLCVTGEQLHRSDIEFQESAPLLSNNREPNEKKVAGDRHKVYMVEQELLRCVREGDCNYKAAQNNARTISAGVRVRTQNPVTQMRVSTITFVSLCVRAAIEGGLSPDTAYTLGDNYIQSILECDTLSGLGSIRQTMYEDFIHRVHRARINPNRSRQVQSCCDYIEMHLEEPLALEDLARRAGYTEYYFSRKFKRETGVNIGEYIRSARIERARAFLTNSEMSIGEIAQRLQFCSSTHFSTAFCSVTGTLPKKYRDEHQQK